MTHLAWRESGFPPERVIGMGGLLDSGRFIHYLSEASGINRSSVEATVIGSHGDEMVPGTSLAVANGRLLEQLIGQSAMDEAAEKTRRGGAEIVGLLKNGSAAYGPAAAVSTMIKAILDDEKRVLPVCCLARGAYGLDNLYINMPAVLGAGGVERIVDLNISEMEAKALTASAEAVRKMVAELG